MVDLRRAALLGWISMALLGAVAGLVAEAPEPLAPVRVATIAPSTTAPPTTTTTVAPPTTTTTPPPPPPPTTTVPAPTTTAAPRPRTTTTSVPRLAAAPATTVPAASAVQSPAAAATPEYAMDLLRQVVPGSWLAAVPARFEVISGKTSWSSFGGLIQVGDWQLTSSVGRAKFTIAHEFGHQIAWKFGTDEFNGAAPAGFPYTGRIPEEQWADCVAQAFTGTSYPTGGLGSCPGDALSFTSRFLAAGPGTPLR